MITWRLSLVVWLVAWWFQPLALADAPKAWGYVGWWLPEGWRSIPLDEIDRLLFVEIKVDGTGNIVQRNGWPEQWTELRNAAQRHKTPLDLTLTLQDPANFDILFSSPAATQRLLDETTGLANQVGVSGLQLDFEIYTRAQPQAIERYQGFVRELARRLHQLTPPSNLSVFFPMGGESALYDAPTLASLDHVMLQGYDTHWPGSSAAGPVAPLIGNEFTTWTKGVAQAAALGVPKERMLLGFPLFGYEWQVKGPALRSPTIGQGISTTFAPVATNLLRGMEINIRDRVRQYGATHHSSTGSAYYQFKNESGQFFEGWFEDWWSLTRKTDYLVSEKLGGIAFFLLGYDNGQLVNYFLMRRGHRSRPDPIRGVNYGF